MSEGDPLMEVRNLAKAYRGRKVVDDISLHVGRGEIVALLGPNGAGKTTTFYMIVGLIRPDAGNVRFQGTDVTSCPMHERARMGIGYLSQEPSVFRKLTVEENILAILETMDLGREKSEARLSSLLDDLGIRNVARQKAYTLSGGERRKVEITRALVRNPLVLLLDEPFSGVDPLSVSDLQKILRGLRDRGLGILITDHNVRETLSVVDRAYLICGGKVLREGTSSFLIRDPESRDLYLGPDFQM